MNTFKQQLIEEGRRTSTPKPTLGTAETEPNISDDVVDVARTIVRDCKPYLLEHEQFDKNPLYRGMRISQKKPLAERQVRQKRKPRDTDMLMHQLWDQWFLQNFGKQYRSNALFVTGSGAVADEFGTIHIVFPLGQFDYVWSPKVKDLTNEVEDKIFGKFRKYNPDAMVRIKTRNKPTEQESQELNQITTAVMDDLDFTSGGLSKAARSRNEIMINCQTYYTIPQRWYEHNRVGEIVKAILQGNVEKYI